MKGDAAAWDQRYATAEFVWTTDPNRFDTPGAIRVGRQVREELAQKGVVR